MASSPPISKTGLPEVDYLAFLKRKWTGEDFVKLLLVAAICGVLWYFFGVVRICQGLPIRLWAWRRYTAVLNNEYGKLVLPIFGFLLWYHRRELAAARKQGVNWGLLVVLLGCLIFAIGFRTLRGHIAMFSGPVLLYGIVLYLFGTQVARILLFPIAFLFLTIPVPALEQATFHLQFLIVGTANLVCNLIGIKVYAVGTTLRAVDGSFGFDIAEGCSGIKSLMAMVMVTAVYVHLTQDRLWKKGVILFFSLGFAIIGNAGRIVTIYIVARWISPALAGGIYHEYSGFVFFPIAVGTMLLLSELLNWRFGETAKALKTAALEPVKAPENDEKGKGEAYDY